MSSRKVRFFVFILINTLVLCSGYLITKIKTEYSITQFLPDNDEKIKFEQELKKYFFLEEYQPLILTITKKSSWLNKQNILALKKLTLDFQKIEGIKKSSSIAVFQTASQSDESINLGSLLELTPEAGWQDRVMADPLLSPMQISKDLKSVVIINQISDYKKIKEISKNTLDMAKSSFSDAQIDIGGVPAVQEEVSGLIKQEISRFLIIALLLNCLSLLIVFKDIVGIFISLVTVIMSVILGLAGMSLLGTSFNVLTTTVPVLITITSMAVATHLQIHYVKLCRQYVVNPVWQTIKELFWPNLLTSLTTAAGFLTLIGSKASLIREYGYTVAILVVVCCAFTNVYVPLALSLFPQPKFRDWLGKKSSIPKWIVMYRKPICISVACFSFVFLFLGQFMSWEIKLFDDLPKQHGVRKATSRLDEKMGGIVPFSFKLSATEVDFWNNPEPILKLDRILKEWRGRVEIGSVLSVPDLIRQNSKNFLEGLPQDRSVIAETYFMYSLSPENPLVNFLSADHKDLRVDLRFHDLTSSQLLNAIESMQGELRQSFPDLQVNRAGLAENGHLLLNNLSRSLVFGFWESMAAIVFMLIFVFRSLFWALISSIPNFLPAIGLVGLLGLTGLSIKPTIAIIFSIALGIAFNNTVYVLSYLLSDFRDKLNDQSIVKVMEREFIPCLMASVSLLSGFSVFLLSYFSLNRWFGIFLILSLVFGLIGDLIFLPAMLSYVFSFLSWKKQEKNYEKK